MRLKLNSMKYNRENAMTFYIKMKREKNTLHEVFIHLNSRMKIMNHTTNSKE